MILTRVSWLSLLTWLTNCDMLVLNGLREGLGIWEDTN